MTKVCLKMGIRHYSVTKQSKHLAFDHPAMEQVRTWTEMAVRTLGVNHQLIGNFDQVWSVHYAHARRILGKVKTSRDPGAPKPTIQKAMDSIKSALGMEVPIRQEEPGSSSRLNPQGAMVPVEYARVARTTTTLSWADGSLGRAFITVGKGKLLLSCI